MSEFGPGSEVVLVTDGHMQVGWFYYHSVRVSNSFYATQGWIVNFSFSWGNAVQEGFWSRFWMLKVIGVRCLLLLLGRLEGVSSTLGLRYGPG